MFADLPKPIQEQTRKAYRQFKEDPSYPSLRRPVKRIGNSKKTQAIPACDSRKSIHSCPSILHASIGIILLSVN